ncbi:ferritin family protein [Geobacter sp. DSM 9736]|uniref:ferritin-like domain-containing protein n=1 Tax=Geobacter sp. DSM 9736 TaxID=1277350 RepID=UPI000B50D275|nr:ferritin family protein [Geobacter sp. DSM 9736]SNB46069.1 Rubrerythrin [Geobacter sp. DSM 9736]
MDLFEFALKMEMDGKAYYEKLAASTSIGGFKAIFSRLAADEQKHYDVVKDIQAGTGAVMADTTVLEDARNVFADLKGDQFLREIKEDLNAYEHAKEIEAESVRLYEGLAEKELDPDNRSLLLKLAEEEKKHFNIMENLYDFVLRPKYYLEWREFSNLGQL